MPIEYKKNIALFKDFVTVEDAEGLLGWLLKKKSAHVDFSACTHIHLATLQVLIVGKPTVDKWPVDQDFARWIRSAIEPE